MSICVLLKRVYLLLSALMIVCASAQGCGDTDANASGCEPGAAICDGNRVFFCGDDGRTLYFDRDCPSGTLCQSGLCLNNPQAGGGAPQLPENPRIDVSQGHESGADDSWTGESDSAEEDVEPWAGAHDSGSEVDVAAPDGGWRGERDSSETPPPDSISEADTGADPDVMEPDVSDGSSHDSSEDDGGTDLDVGADGDSGPSDAGPTEDVAPPTDTSPAAVCGNGALDFGEDCDPALEGQTSCAQAGFSGVGQAVCTAACKWSAAGCKAPGALAFTRVQQTLVIGGLTHVRWHPNGEWALLLGPKKLVRYDVATDSVSAVADFHAAIAMDVSPDGKFFLVVGQKSGGTNHLWRVVVGEGGALSVVEEAGSLMAGTPASIRVVGYDNLWVIAHRNSQNYINHLLLWKDGEGVVKNKGYNNVHVRDVMAGQPAVYGGAWTLITSDGINGAGSKSFLIDADTVVDNGWKASFGNPGRGAWRPLGQYGFFTAGTTNKMYVYDSTWTMVTLPNTPTGGIPIGVSWNQAGTRALIVGAAIGTPLRAVVIDHRPSGIEHNASDYFDASIQGYDKAPFFGSNYASLQDVHWRPGCEEGLIVGEDSGTSFSPTFAMVLRFADVANPCTSSSGTSQ